MNTIAPSERDRLRLVVLRVLRKRRWPIISGVAVFAAVTGWTFLATPRYKSEALLRIESKTSTPALPDALQSLPGAGLAGLGKDDLETEVGVLKSERIVDAAIDSLALYVRVRTPADNRASVVQARVTGPVDADGKLGFDRRSDGRYDVSSSKLEGFGALPAIIAPGESFRVGGLLLTLPSGLRSGGIDRIRLQLMPRYKVRKRMENRLTIRKQEGGSRLVEVAFEDPDRVLAAQVVDRIVHEYLAYTLRTEKGDVTGTVGELHDAIARNATRLATAEELLRAFQQRELLIVPDEQAAAQVKRIAALDTKVDAVRIERSALARLLALIADRSRGGSDPTAYRQLATFPSLINNRAIQDLLQALIELENKRAELGVRLTEEGDEYRAIAGRITELDRQLYRLGSQYLESLDQSLASTAHAVTVLTDTLQELPATALRYTRLVRDRSVENETFILLQKSLKQAELQDIMRKERVRIVDAPRVAHFDDPEFPKPAVQLTLGAVLAVVVALAVALLGLLFASPGGSTVVMVADDASSHAS